MTKILKIRFVKFERALAMQILQQVGEFKDGRRIRIAYVPVLEQGCLFLRGNCSKQDYSIPCIDFTSNAECNEYLEKAVKWISEEQFAMGGKLEVGKLCEVSNNGEHWVWESRELLAILPESYKDRYITNAADSKTQWIGWPYARPIASCVQPKIDGDTYTWQMEVE